MAIKPDRTVQDEREHAGQGRGRQLASARQSHILSLLRQTGSVQVTEVAADLGVSDMTIRRDLADMEREGRLTRVHGGAVPAASGGLDEEPEPRFEVRMRAQAPAKQAIAATAAKLVTGCRTLAIDIGTTTFLTARLLSGLDRAHVFTNSLRIAGLLAGRVEEIYVPAGRVRPDELSIVGPEAVANFARLWFDLALIGVSGVTADGFHDYTFEEVDLKRVYLQRSARSIVLCDAAKFGRLSLVPIGPLDTASTIVTDAVPPEPLRSALAAANVELIVAPADRAATASADPRQQSKGLP